MGNIERETLASEIYSDLKESIKFKQKMIVWLCVVIALLVLALAGTNIYHIHQWSQFDTIYVESDGSGNANYVDGDNNGGIYNGKDYSPETEEWPIEGQTD